MIEHYNQAIRPNGFKAMVVAETREAAVAYKSALDKLIDPALSAVVMTVDKREEWAEKYWLSDEAEGRIKERFNDPKDPLCFLVVCDKLLTGFDSPILQAMYMDKRLKEHTLLQAVARANRTYPRKNFGLIVDYAGIGKELAQALEQFSAEDLAGLFRTDDVEREIKALATYHKATIKFFAGISLRGEPRTIIQSCLEALRDETVRGEFDKAYRAFAKSLDTIEFGKKDLREYELVDDFENLRLLVLLTSPHDPADLKREQHERAPTSFEEDERVECLLANIAIALQFGEFVYAKFKYTELLDYYNKCDDREKQRRFPDVQRAYDMIQYVSKLDLAAA